MAEWLCCLVRTNKVLCSNLGAARHRMTLGAGTNGCLSRITRMMHTDYVRHTPALLAGQCVWEAQVIERRNSTSGRPFIQSYS